MAMGERGRGTDSNQETVWFVYQELSKVITDHAFTYRQKQRNPHFTTKVLNTRIDYLMASLAETLGLKEPFPSAPKRWGQYCIWSEFKGRMMIRSFCEKYAAKYYLDELIKGSNITWISDKEILIADGPVVKSDYLEELMEHEFTKKEEQWKLPPNYAAECDAFRRGEKVTMSDGNNQSASPAKVKRPDADPKPEKVKKERAPRPDGLIALQDICVELKIEPKDARTVLRSKKIEKPAHGRWEWPQEEVAAIKKVIAGAGKK